MDVKKTGLLITHARKEKSMTQKELACKLHVSDRTISKWERGAGFPDVTILKPLADELGISVLSLLRGEQDLNDNEVQNEGTVRDAIKIVYNQYRKKVRKNISTLVASVILFVILGGIIFAVLDYSGVFLKDISCKIPAVIYENGETVGETFVTIEGSLQSVGEKSFNGKFFIDCVEVTGRDGVNGYITWDRIEEGYQEISYSRAGNLGYDAGIKPYLYISPDMQQFALELNDGRIVATDSCLAKLQDIEDCRYAISYETHLHYSE